MATNDDQLLPIDLSDQNHIDKLCDEFEATWRSGGTPDIQVFLEQTRPDLRTTLFIELVRVEIEYTPTNGRPPSLEDYVRRFPQFKEQLEQIQFVTKPMLETLATLKRIGKLQLIRFIDSGAFGQVWRAWDTELEREVAVKLPTDRSLGREYETEFRREAKAAAKLNHLGIVRVISFGTENGIAYIVYDFVDGVTLRKWLESNPVSPKSAAELCAKIADALSHAHEHRVIHRDLKPANILIDREGNPRITDFGLAIRMDSTSASLVSDAIVGTLAYMSPEQAEGKSRNLDPRTDLYSLGAILYEMLVGQPVYQGNAREIFQQILDGTPPALTTKSPGIDPDLATICHKCLEKEKSDRYRTAKDVADDLRRFLRGEPVTARPLSHLVRAWRWLRKQWLMTLTGFAVVGCMILAVILLWGQGQQKEEQTQQAEGPRPQREAATWKVLVTTNPAGAFVHVIPRQEETGELLRDRQIMPLQTTPIVLELAPSLYQVEVTLSNNLRRSHQVNRTVPPVEATSPAGAYKFREFDIVGEQELAWPEIVIPEADITDQMVYVKGTDAFRVGRSGQAVRIDPFFVSPREFTYGDFQKIRPGGRGDNKAKPVQQPQDNTMLVSWDAAEHWAEESGGRLLTELEFEYLAVLAAQAERESLRDPNEVEKFEVAGGSLRDAIVDVIPTKPSICGILSGYAEWTSSLPNQSKLWPPLPLEGPASYRIVRGGTDTTKPGEFFRDPRQRTALLYYQAKLGFRLARSASLPPTERK